jgi:hypothetical protein
VLPRILPLFEVFPKLPVPRVVKLGFILPWTRSPSELYPHLSRLSGPLVTGSDLPLRFGAFQRHPRSGP